MTNVEGLNSAIAIYLRGNTTRYLERGEYGSLSAMMNSTDRDFVSLAEFIERELIVKIAYSWNNRIHDIGAWRYDPMFRYMYNTITQNPVLISHMIDAIKAGRRGDGLEELTEYSQVDVMRHYAYYHAFSLGEDFFSEIIGEFFNRDPEDDDDIPNNRRRPYDDTSDDESDDDDIPELNDTPTRIPPPV
jgi:hypothetical protein